MRVRSAAASSRLVVAVAVAAAACKDAPRPSADAAPEQSARASATSANAASASPSAEPRPAHVRSDHDASAPAICRVVSSEGGPGPTADASAWTPLAEKASFSVRNRETGKEIRFEGPATVRPCAGDVTLVASGTAATFPGAGEAPGNELWVATPCAVARWAGGVHRVTVDKDGCRIQASLGSSFIWVPEGAAVEEADAGAPASDGGAPTSAGRLGAPDAGWRRLDGRHAVRVRLPSSQAAAGDATTACEKAALDVTSLAARMTDGGSDRDLGALTVESIAARRRARAACALAAARVQASALAAPGAPGRGPPRELAARVAKATEALGGAP